MKTQSLPFYRGDTARWQVRIFQPGGTLPLDLTGVIVKAEIRQNSGTTPITPVVCVVTLPNTIDCSLAPAATQALPASAKWDLQLTYPSGDVQTVVKGSVSVTGDVTDSLPVSVAGGCYA
jgi:hypothetical protein